MWPTEQNLEAWEHRYGARDEVNRGLPEAVRERLPDLEGARLRAPDAAFFQAELDEIPLQFRRNRFTLVYASEGALAQVRELGPFASALTAALRKNGRLMLHDWHPVFACIDPIDLRWRQSYFSEGLWRVGQVAVAFGSSLDLTEIEELPPDAAAARLDPRLPTNLLLNASKP
jgi:hypothetical protein